MADCEHPEKMKAPWTKYRKDDNDRWTVGWVCAGCGHVETTGVAPSKPYFAKEPS